MVNPSPIFARERIKGSSSISPLPHSRHILAMSWRLFFGRTMPKAPRSRTFRVSLYRLRQLLGDDDDEVQHPFLLISRTTVQFNPDSAYSLDVVDLLRALEGGDLETVVSRYQGDLVAGFTCNSLFFENWLRQERERYHRLTLDALFNLTAQKLAQADYNTAQNLARQQLMLEPWREEAHRQLIQAQALQGNRTAAIAQYETCRAVLAEELGLEPSAETTELATRVRELEVAQTSRPGRAMRPPATSPSPLWGARLNMLNWWKRINKRPAVVSAWSRFRAMPVSARRG